MNTNINSPWLLKVLILTIVLSVALQVVTFFQRSALSSRVTDLEVLVGLAAPEPTNSVDAPKP